LIKCFENIFLFTLLDLLIGVLLISWILWGFLFELELFLSELWCQGFGRDSAASFWVAGWRAIFDDSFNDYTTVYFRQKYQSASHKICLFWIGCCWRSSKHYFRPKSVLI
jgi:hypothetical protein